MKKIITADTYISLQIDCFLRLAKDSLDRKSKEPDLDICKNFVDKFLELNNAEVFEYEYNKEVAQKEVKEKDERIKELEKEIENYEINILKVMKSNSVEVQAHSVTRKKLTIAVAYLKKIKGIGIPTGYELEIADEALKQIGEMK